MKSLALTLALTSLISIAAAASPIRIENPWSRATAPGQVVGGGFMTIVNTGNTADRLVSVTSAAAAEVQIHHTSMDGGVMRMRQLTDGLEIPAAGRVELKPRGLHLMFMQLKAPLDVGSSFPVQLQFEKAGTLTAQFKVENR
jgi:copper(I)-binding protein